MEVTAYSRSDVTDLRSSGALRRMGIISFLVRSALSLCLLAPLPAAAVDMSPLVGQVLGSGNRNLVVILHGDGGPGRYDEYAQALAAAASRTTVVTLNRPGFNGSPGCCRSKDHYTRSNNALLAESLATMKASLRPSRMIVMGHSGGAAQLATIIATHPGIVDVAILAACPCNVPSWRVHRRGQNNWTNSQSPHRFAHAIPRSTQVLAITNQRDSNTRLRFAQEYVQIAQAAGANVQLYAPEGGNHRWSSYMRNVDALIRQSLR